MKTDNMIFVFGSNEAGIHGAGAAKYALEHKGAMYGKGFGPHNQSFAIPTKDWMIQSLPLEVIGNYIDRFYAYAKLQSSHHFQVTAIGCGLAGFSHSQMANLFRRYGTLDRPDTLPNVYFDELWKPYLCVNAKFWGTF